MGFDRKIFFTSAHSIFVMNVVFALCFQSFYFLYLCSHIQSIVIPGTSNSGVECLGLYETVSE
jgi:hypothetical protein